VGGGAVKNFICVLVLVAMVGLVACAGRPLDKWADGRAPEESKLGKGAFQKMNVTCWGFCSISKGNSK
tara:strand:- start:462 stop:665 length:204 start_codon:yes stop_codon:yes gene_type:complete